MEKNTGNAEAPQALLAQYDLEIKNTTRDSGKWDVDCKEGKFCLWEYRGPELLLSQVLDWQEILLKKGYPGFPGLILTKNKERTIAREKIQYFLTRCPPGSGLVGKDPAHLTALTGELGRLHRQSLEMGEVKADKERSWMKLMQDRLTDLLYYHQFLSSQRLSNDYERIFIECFDQFYTEGQEAVQSMGVAGCDSPRTRRGFLINSFSPHLVKIHQGQVCFTDLTKCDTGPLILDLSLVINMYLPQNHWDLELVQEMIAKYREDNQIKDREWHLLLALLRFPGRYWLYSYQYFHGLEKASVLVEKMREYCYELNRKKHSLQRLEKWLIGE